MTLANTDLTVGDDNALRPVKELPTIDAHSGPPKALCLSGDGSLRASSFKSTIQVYAVDTGELTSELKFDNDTNGTFIAQEGHMVSVGRLDNFQIAHVYQLEGGMTIYEAAAVRDASDAAQHRFAFFEDDEIMVWVHAGAVGWLKLNSIAVQKEHQGLRSLGVQPRRETTGRDWNVREQALDL